MTQTCDACGCTEVVLSPDYEKKECTRNLCKNSCIKCHCNNMCGKRSKQCIIVKECKFNKNCQKQYCPFYHASTENGTSPVLSKNFNQDVKSLILCKNAFEVYHEAGDVISTVYTGYFSTPGKCKFDKGCRYRHELNETEIHCTKDLEKFQNRWVKY